MYRNTSVCKRLAERSGSISVFGQSIFHGSAGQLNIVPVLVPLQTLKAQEKKNLPQQDKLGSPLYKS